MMSSSLLSRLLASLLLIFTCFSPAGVSAQETGQEQNSAAANAQKSEKDFFGKLSEAIEDGAKPIADKLNAVVFYEIPFSEDVQVPVLIILLAGTGIFLTLWFGFINIRAFGLALKTVRGKYTRKNAPGEITHFQALSSALAATVGLGNIGGVAIAIGVGGPGAALWMILLGFFGMSTKFAECTLGVRYRNVSANGKVQGGGMYYLSKGFAEMGKGWAVLGMILAVAFACFTLGGTFGAGGLYQVNQAHSMVSNTFDVLKTEENNTNGLYFGIIMATLVALVIIGGIKSIGRVTSILVPVMCLIYLLACIAVLAINFTSIPTAFGQIFSSAFAPGAVAGGLIGALIQGVQRSVFSNEAGSGSSAMAHAAVKTDKPASEGVVALLEPFVDTVVVCTMTALVVIVSGAWAVDATVKEENQAPLVFIEQQQLDIAQEQHEKSQEGIAKKEQADFSMPKHVSENGQQVALLPAKTEMRILTKEEDKTHGDWGQLYPSEEMLSLLQTQLESLGRTERVGSLSDGVSHTFTLESEDGSLVPVSLWTKLDKEVLNLQMDITKTKSAFETVLPWFPYILAIAVFLFAFSSSLSWGYYGEQAVLFLAGGRYRPKLVLGYKVFFCCVIMMGASMSIDNVLGISDALFFLMVAPNLIGLFFLLPKIRESLNDFLAHAKAIDRGEKTKEDV